MKPMTHRQLSPPLSPLSDKEDSGSPRSRNSPRPHNETPHHPHSPRHKVGSAGARRHSPPRHPPAEGKRASPLAKRLGEDVPFMLPHPSKQSQGMPGVVIGTFAGGGGGTGVGFGVDDMNFDGSMDDILDPTATRSETRHNSSAGQGNIAPWLMDDAMSPPAVPIEPPSAVLQLVPLSRDVQRKQSIPALSHFASVPALPKVRRNGNVESVIGPSDNASASSSRSGSHPAIYPSGLSAMTGRNGSQAGLGAGHSTSTSTASTRGKKNASPSIEPAVLPMQTARQSSVAQNRMSRFGSTASAGSSSIGSGSEKKKGFLGGVFKRKATLSEPFAAELPIELSFLGNSNDFGGTEPLLRGSTDGSGSSKHTVPSPAHERPHPTYKGDPDSFLRAQMRPTSSYTSEMISPTAELTGFNLDLDLDNMEGIVDANLANAPAPTPASFRLPTMPPGASGRTTTSDSTTGFGSVLLQDALRNTSSYGTTVSRESTESSPSAEGQSPPQVTPNRSVLSEADRHSSQPFVRNPFFGSLAGVTDGKPRTPPSPHTLSPKHALPPASQPRRPSQLRNVKMGSIDSEGSSVDGSPVQSLPPAWGQSAPAGQTVFNDPFHPTQKRDPSGFCPPSFASVHPGNSPNEAAVPSPTGDRETASHVPSIAPLGVGAAWAAPESWGVEGDEEPEDTSSSSEDEWVVPEEARGSTHNEGISHPGPLSPPAPGKQPPPFGFKSASVGAAAHTREASENRIPSQGQRARTKTSNGRPLTAQRPGTSNRPGTAGSSHGAGIPFWIRICRSDGTFSNMSFSLHATTTEIASFLNGANEGGSGKKVTTNLRLYIREKGQDRQLLPSERPLLIQDRRLRQAGYTDHEKIEELGKEDLGIMCKFIWQTPPLPVMNPEEESSYDSFEFIDIAGRDLQTIPIFLHLHAHNIIILNVSRNPMTDLPLDFIQDCTNLKELRMSNVSLKRIPASIRASSTLARIDFSCNRIADLESTPMHEITTLLSFKIQNNRLTSLPRWFGQMKALKYLNISNNKFELFPDVLCEMSNLVDLDVSFNNIAELPADLSNLKSLEQLAVFGNEITTLPDSFSTLANLRVLDVRRNRLTDLTAVYALPNLQNLMADHNNLVTLDAQIGAKVTQFRVPHNSITRFTLAPLRDMAAVTYALTKLNLSHGNISTLADEALTGLVNLVELNLNFNQFTRLPTTIDQLTNLEVLDCTDNLLHSLPFAFSKLLKLRILNVHNNNLKTIPTEIWLCPSLESINASSNLLETAVGPPDREKPNATPLRKQSVNSIDEDRIPPMGRSLRRLYLGDNRYTDDIFHAVALLPFLRVLNLSFNEIYEIPPYTLAQMEHLEQLYLSGNKLTSLPAEDLEKLQNLKVLHLNGNKLQTLPSELGAIVGLQHLDVGSNVLKYNIANWPYDWNWNWNTSLRYLNLSGNKRLEIKPTSAQDMTHSKGRKELSDFTALSHLRLLGLMDVTLRIPSVPDESAEKRVRTSFSDVNNMAYGISDMLGSSEHLAMFDLVVPNFRGKPNECLFGMFGRHAPAAPSGRIPKIVSDRFSGTFTQELARLQPTETVSDALRRSFLRANRITFGTLLEQSSSRTGRPGSGKFDSFNNDFHGWAPGMGSVFRTGTSGAVVYLVDKTLHVANVGDTLVVISRKGEAELFGKHHDPTDREETARLRQAEAWVSTKGIINDDREMNISRALGYYHHFPAVSADPEIRTRQLVESDEFVIIGNAALWNCCSYQTAVDIARTERDDPMMAAQKLRDFAISYGADGSVMVMIINIADLFFGRGGRSRGVPGSGTQTTADSIGDGDAYYGSKRNVRRRYEEVGDRTLNRLQQEIEPPEGQVAIVFTDIVNSTHLWETNPGMPTAIKMHHNLMRRQLRLDGGYEVKTEGDSFMVSFQTVTAAVLWAFNCQIGLLQQEWPRELLEAHDGKVVHDSEGNLVQRGLRVRMGVHWGAPQCERDPITRRMDYYGPMVNRAARINASADGGQLMASQDVINEMMAVREYMDSVDEAELGNVPPEMKREVQELRRIGLEVKDMGERKLKGLEVPEKLHLLYPKTLSGRFELSSDLRANVEVGDARGPVIHAPRSIDITEVRDLVKLTLRLEALCAQSATSSSPPTSPSIPLPPAAGQEGTTAKRRTMGQLPPPSYLGPNIVDEMTDAELGVIIESLTTRMENCLSTLYLKHLGGFGTVLAALEQATRIDQRLIVHAMSLMSGLMGT